MVMQVCAEAGGGVVSTRDFVNLRHWALVDGVYISAGGSVNHPAMPPQVALLYFFVVNVTHLSVPGTSQPIIFSVEEGARGKRARMLGDEACGGPTWSMPLSVASRHRHQGCHIFQAHSESFNSRVGYPSQSLTRRCPAPSLSTSPTSDCGLARCALVNCLTPLWHLAAIWQKALLLPPESTSLPWTRSHLKTRLKSRIILPSCEPQWKIKMHCPDQNWYQLAPVWKVSCCERKWYIFSG